MRPHILLERNGNGAREGHTLFILVELGFLHQEKAITYFFNN